MPDVLLLLLLLLHACTALAAPKSHRRSLRQPIHRTWSPSTAAFLLLLDSQRLLLLRFDEILERLIADAVEPGFRDDGDRLAARIGWQAKRVAKAAALRRASLVSSFSP